MLAYTRLCLEKLFENTTISFNLIIIDNGSNDNTERFFEKLMQNKPFLIYKRNEKNLGPIIAYNQGIRLGKSKYVCMMHNDVLILEKGWLDKILTIMDSHPEIGIAGLAGRKRINKKGLVDEKSLIHNLQNENLNEPMRSNFEYVAVIDGLCFIVKRDILDRTNGLNETYGYMHCYDLDISLSSISLGYKNAVVNVEAMHISNGGVTRRSKVYREIVQDDYKLLNMNYKKFRRKWKNMLPVEVE